MKMILVIDGFNLIYKFSELESYIYNNELEKAMYGLIECLCDLSSKINKRHQIYVFFDGKKRMGDDTYQEVIKGIHCYYSHEDSADSLIEEFIKNKRIKNISGIRVISSDKKIQNFTKKYKYEYQSSEDFYEWYKGITLEKSDEQEKPDKISKKELNYWLNVFKNR
jgi:predicted RNA-binding protein with PIN domain